MKKIIWLLAVPFLLASCSDDTKEKDYTPSKNISYNKKITGHWKQLNTRGLQRNAIMTDEFKLTFYAVTLPYGDTILTAYDKTDYLLNVEGLFTEENSPATFFYRVQSADTIYFKEGGHSFTDENKYYRVK